MQMKWRRKMAERRRITIEEKIEKAQDKVVAAKDRYDAAVAEFKELIAKRDAIRKDELMKAFVESGKTYEEVMAFLQEGSDTAEEEKPKKRGGRKRKNNG